MQTESKIKVWDPLIRIFHWTLVVAFLVAFITEEDVLQLHVWAGYTVFFAVLMRMLWGFVGTRYARFSDFVTSPKVAFQYVADTLLFRAKRYIGHNPAGGLMIVVMIVSLFLTTISGIAVYGIEEQAGPMAGWFASHTLWEDVLEELHEFLSFFTLFLVLVHVAGVLIESAFHKENLVRSMIDGLKNSDTKQQKEPENA